MQIPALHESWHLWHVAVSALGGATVQRVAFYVSNKMPPLPSNSGWWQQFGYSLMKGISGLDPSATISGPWDGKTDRRGKR